MSKPAFPSRSGMFFYVPKRLEEDIKGVIDEMDRDFAGMSERTYIATKMMAALVSRSSVHTHPGGGATLAVGYADALLAELGET